MLAHSGLVADPDASDVSDARTFRLLDVSDSRTFRLPSNASTFADRLGSLFGSSNCILMPNFALKNFLKFRTPLDRISTAAPARHSFSILRIEHSAANLHYEFCSGAGTLVHISKLPMLAREWVSEANLTLWACQTLLIQQCAFELSDVSNCQDPVARLDSSHWNGPPDSTGYPERPRGSRVPPPSPSIHNATAARMFIMPAITLSSSKFKLTFLGRPLYGHRIQRDRHSAHPACHRERPIINSGLRT